MHYRTEDLLSIRDRQPLDAATRGAIEADPSRGIEIERLRRVRDALATLPELEPPHGVWQRVLAVDATVRVRAARLWRGLAGAGIAAGVAAVALIYAAREPDAPPAAPSSTTIVANGARVVPLSASVGSTSDAPVIEESARLDRLLAAMPRPRPMMNGATAGTIVGLEDRIAAIDQQLSYGAARGLQPPESQALWSERVELMNALVHVRYAQAAGF